ERLPGQILTLVPSTGGPGHPHRALGRATPFAPGVALECGAPERLELLREAAAHGCRERGREPDVVEITRLVVQPEEEGADELARPALVPAEARHHAVGRARVLHLDHHALAGLVRRALVLGDDPVETRALEPMEPVLGRGPVAGARGEVDAAARTSEGGLE